MIHERVRRTDRHRMTSIAALMHSIARQKSAVRELYISFGPPNRWLWAPDRAFL